MIIWADSQDSKLSSRARVIEVKEESPNVTAKLKDRSFSVLADVQGAEKELVFACNDKDSKELWVQSCKYGLARIEEEEKYMTELFTLEIKFCEEKLGIRVEEVAVEEDDSEVDGERCEDKAEAPTKLAESETTDAGKPDDES